MRDNAIPPRAGTHPPTYPNPPPRAVTGIFSSEAKRSSLLTSFADLAKTTTSGWCAANHLSPLCAASVSGSAAIASSPNNVRSPSPKVVLMLVIVIVLDVLSFDYREGCPRIGCRPAWLTRPVWLPSLATTQGCDRLAP